MRERVLTKIQLIISFIKREKTSCMPSELKELVPGYECTRAASLHHVCHTKETLCWRRLTEVLADGWVVSWSVRCSSSGASLRKLLI